MTALWFFVGVLATYRLARMLAMEDGPFDLFSTLREKAGQRTWIGRGLNCTLCLSFWLALPFTLLLPISSWQEFIITWLAVAGGVVIVHKVIG